MAKIVKYQASKGFLEITPDSFKALEEAILWAEGVPRRFNKAMSQLAFHMAVANQGEARLMSAGRSDPSQQQPSVAWKIPVRRITGNYYVSWKVRAVGRSAWELYNDSREAYFIEYGISEVGWGTGRHVPKRRIRRPIRKLSLRRTLQFLERTHVYHRVWANIFEAPGGAHHGGFYQIIQSPAGGHSRWEPATQHEASGVIRRVVRAGRGHEYRRFVRLTRAGWQVRTPNSGGGTYGGPMLGRRIR